MVCPAWESKRLPELTYPTRLSTPVMAAFSQSPCDGSLLSHAILSAWDTLSSLLAGLFPITLQSCHFFKNLSLTSLAR
jgi:hypothetical protein